MSHRGNSAKSNASYKGSRYFVILAILALSASFLGVRFSRADSQQPSNQWVPVGPLGAAVLTMVFDPMSSNTVYAGTFGGGVFKSTDTGSSWRAANSGLFDGQISDLAIDPNSGAIYCVTSGSLFTSTDGAATWSVPYSDSSNLPISMSTVVTDPKSSTTVYVGGNQQVSKSTDSGVTWAAGTSGLTGSSLDALAIDPSNSSNLYAGFFQGGVFQSTDAGANWNTSGAGAPTSSVFAVAVDPVNSGTVYAAATSGVYKTIDAGAHWTQQANSPGGAESLAIDPSNHNVVYSGTNNTVFKTTDGGGAWNPASTGLPPSSVIAITIDPVNDSNLLLGTTNNGIFKSSDGAASWAESESGVNGFVVPAMLVDPASGSVYAGTRTGLQKSTDGGGTWNPANNGLGGSTDLLALAIDSKTSPGATIYLAGNDRLFYSTDAGATWNRATQGLPDSAFFFALAVDPNKSGTAYAGSSSQGLFRTTDGGMSWTEIGDANLGTPRFQSIAVDPVHRTNIYAGLDSGGAFRSTDDGATWSAASKGFPFSELTVSSIVVDPKSGTVYAGTDFGVFSSKNHASSWTQTSVGIEGNGLFVSELVLDTVNSKLYAATDAGVYVSSDGAQSWTSISTGLSGLALQILGLAIAPNSTAAANVSLYAGTDGASVQKYLVDGTSPVIANASFDGKKTITIQGMNFGKSATVTVNGSDVSKFVKSDTGSVIKVKAKEPLLGLVTGANTIQVTTPAGGPSNVFVLTL